jgi:pimeloyl-ACP methyl ester carboxylesterase
MGGYVSFALVRHVASRVRALVLADTKSPADTPEGVEGRKKMLATLEAKGPTAIADEMVARLLGETTRHERPELVARVRELILASPSAAIAGAIRALMTRPDSTPVLSTIHCPTLILVGAEDTLTPPSNAEEMHRAIPGSELVTVSGSGHLSNLENATAFNAALARFLTYRV